MEGTGKPDPAAYQQSLAQRTGWIRRWNLFMRDYPLLLCPVLFEPPFQQGRDTASSESSLFLREVQMPNFTIPVLGLPAISVPTGTPDGLPTGVQIVAPRFGKTFCWMLPRSSKRAGRLPRTRRRGGRELRSSKVRRAVGDAVGDRADVAALNLRPHKVSGIATTRSMFRNKGFTNDRSWRRALAVCDRGFAVALSLTQIVGRVAYAPVLHKDQIPSSIVA
jgi:hypothetical protein